MERCWLCSAKRGPKTALHRFPKDPAIRASWIRFCGLNESTDDVSKLSLCTAHFLPSDYLERRAKELGFKLQLKPKTVPSIFKRKVKKEKDIQPVSDAGEGTSQYFLSPKPIFHEEVQQTPSIFERKVKKEEDIQPVCDAEEGTNQYFLNTMPMFHEEVQQTPSIFESKVKEEDIQPVSDAEEGTSQYFLNRMPMFHEEVQQTPSIFESKVKEEDIQPVSDAEEGTSQYFLNTMPLFHEEVQQTPSIFESKVKEEDIQLVSDAEEGTSQYFLNTKPMFHEEVQQTPKKRRFADPRYPGEIRSSDVDTPDKAKRCLLLAKSKINEQTIKIRRLRQTNRRLQRKLRSLNDSVNRLKSKNLI